MDGGRSPAINEQAVNAATPCAAFATARNSTKLPMNNQSRRQHRRRACPQALETSARGRSGHPGRTPGRPRVSGRDADDQRLESRARQDASPRNRRLPENYPGVIRAERRVEASRTMRTRQRQAKTPLPQDAQPGLFDLLQTDGRFCTFVKESRRCFGVYKRSWETRRPAFEFVGWRNFPRVLDQPPAMYPEEGLSRVLGIGIAVA